MVRAWSPFEGFGKMTPGRPQYGAPPPPPWPIGPDPRTDACQHDWDTNWGEPGERQHQCLGCDRWIWDRSIWAARTGRPT